MKRDSEICLVFAGDDAFAMPMAVALHSALIHLDKAATAYVYVLDGGLSVRSRVRLEKVIHAARRKVHSSFITAASCLPDGLKVTEYLSRSTYLKLLIPELIPRRFERAIYLDGDILVRGDLGLLWKQAFDGHPLLAAQDTGAPFVASSLGLENYAQLGLDPGTPYMNGGVLVFDLRKWRQERIADAVLDYLRENARYVRWCDQDGLNAVLWNRWGKLDRKWNAMPHAFMPDMVIDEQWSLRKELETSRDCLFRNFQLVHFACCWAKPWQKDCRHPLKFLWVRCLLQSGWFRCWEKWPWLAQWVFRRWLFRVEMTTGRLAKNGRFWLSRLMKRRSPRLHRLLKAMLRGSPPQSSLG